MSLVVNFSQMFHVHMGIALGSAYTDVAEQFLHYPDIAAGIHEVCGETVPQGMGMDVLSEA